MFKINGWRLAVSSLCAFAGLGLAPTFSHAAAVAVSVANVQRGTDTIAATVRCAARSHCSVRLVARTADGKTAGSRTVGLGRGKALNVGLGISARRSAALTLTAKARARGRTARTAAAVPVHTGLGIIFGDVYRVQASPSSSIVRLVAMRKDTCAQGVALRRLVQTGASVAVAIDVGVPVAGQPAPDSICGQAITPFCVSVDLGRRLGGRIVLAGPRNFAVPSLAGPTSYAGAALLAKGDCPRIAVGHPAVA